MSSYLLPLLVFALTASANPIRVRATTEGQDDDTPTVDEAENGPDGHLTEPWVVGVAVAFSIIIAGVAAIVIFLKLRQRRRRRQQQNDLSRSDPLNPRPSREQTWKGPYTSRASYTRSPSPPSKAHLREAK